MQFLSGSLSFLLAGFRTTIHRAHFITVAGGVALLAASAFFISCGGSSSSSNVAPPPVPAITNVNSSTSPTSPVGLPIEINGTGFQNSPGQVVFTQASSGITATVTPSAGGWSDTGIAVNVPTGNGTTNFTLPGTVTVAVKTSGGTSNTVDLNLIQTLTFDVNNVQWTQAASLPTPLAGLRAVAIPVSDTSAYVVTTGGYDGSSNTFNVYVGALDPTGNITGWTASPNVLPQPIAHHGMVEANPENSLVPVGSAFLYVIGGQVNVGDGANGTTAVESATFDPTSGAVGKWTQLNSSLPESLVGPAVTMLNGYVYVIGGLKSDGTPSTDVFSAPVNADGTLGTWTQSPDPYPKGISFATAVGFAGKLYVIDGDSASSTNPNAQSASGIQDVNYASAANGTVGAWTLTSATIKNRMKHITWTAFGQIIDAEGLYNGQNSLELERTQVNADSTLQAWNGITSTVNQISANVYNAAAVVSPVASAAQTPRFILIGGQKYSSLGAGAITSTVYYNTAP